MMSMFIFYFLDLKKLWNFTIRLCVQDLDVPSLSLSLTAIYIYIYIYIT
uniref:Uncharacterized protein n=1 Tax=Lepeophtheirus salmonis TaxID=72036 RepID=A0A0K2UEI7_LEPSM